MTSRRLAGALALGLTTALYCLELGQAPVYLGGDEAHFAVHAYSIAHTGRDLDGRAMPLLFNLADPVGDPHNVDTSRRWYQPMLFYVLAAALKLVPFSEAWVRLPTALIGGLLDPLLMYVVAMRLFRNRLYAAVAAMTLVLSPPHVILSRQALDYVCSIPFVLGWLWCLVVSIQTGSVGLSFAAGALLGVGAYSYIAGWVLMPLFLVLTWIAQHRSEGRFGRAAAAAGLGFLLPLVPLLLWLWTHPEVLRATIGRYEASDPSHLPLGLSLRKFFNLGAVANRVSVYWDYFNPSFLFATGGVNMTASTGRAGVFLLPAAVFLPVGVYHALKHRAFGAVGILLIAAFAVAPIPATLAGERFMIQRELLVVPFGALVAAMGFAHLWRRTQFPGRIVAAALLAAMPLQFAYMYRDYFTHYQHRSVFYYDPAAFRQVAEYLVAAESSGRAPDVYLSSELDDVGAKWRFYATKARREDLLRRTRYFAEDGPEARGIAPGSLAVLYAESGMVARLVRSGAWSVARKVFDIDGRAASVILIKT